MQRNYKTTLQKMESSRKHSVEQQKAREEELFRQRHEETKRKMKDLEEARVVK